MRWHNCQARVQTMSRSCSGHIQVISIPAPSQISKSGFIFVISLHSEIRCDSISSMVSTGVLFLMVSRGHYEHQCTIVRFPPPWYSLTLHDSLWCSMTLHDSGWLWMTLDDFGWLWMTLDDFKWLWMTLYYSSWLWITPVDSGWLQLTLDDSRWL